MSGHNQFPTETDQLGDIGSLASRAESYPCLLQENLYIGHLCKLTTLSVDYFSEQSFLD